MRRIINQKKYDTNTATKITFIKYLYPSDFHWFTEVLYRKKNGEFFLCGKGGPLSKYGEEYSNGQLSGGSAIIPLSLEDAKAWCEKVLNVDEYEEIFGEVEE